MIVVSGILGKRCDNQSKAICSYTEVVKTMNWKGSAQQEDKSYPPPT
jgi:hypothetical protein